METTTHQVRAHNTAEDSENAIHHDDVASALGFRGGLVPGADVWAYMAHVPAARWGLAWLERGEMRAEFRRPVYDGDEVVVTGITTAPDATTLEAHVGEGEPCARGAAVMPDRVRHDMLHTIPRAPLPAERPAASPETLAPGTLLGTFEIGFRADRAAAYLEAVRETLPLFRERGLIHPAWMLRTVNWALAANVRLGPWIHTASEVHHLGLGGDGDRLSVRARVLEEYERSGHRWVVLDALVVAGDVRPLMRARHTAIYRPRGAA